jgi:hypothetical protein
MTRAWRFDVVGLGAERRVSRLPFPGHPREVPEFSGGHHERMDGKKISESLRIMRRMATLTGFAR